MKKYFKAWASLFVAAAVILTVIFSTITTSQVYAAGDQGNRSTAMQKLWYRSLKSCIGNGSSVNGAWNIDVLVIVGSTQITVDRVTKGNWFTDAWSLDWSGTHQTVWGGGAYIENAVAGEFSDGKIYCGENNNALVSMGLNALGLSTKDVACNYFDGYASSGVFYVDSSATTCSDRYNSGEGSFNINSNRGDYFERLVRDKTFNGTVPGGSLDSLTNIEKYYVYSTSFKTACAGGNANFGNTNLAYQVIEWNSTTKRFEQAGYSQKNGTSPSTKVYTFGGEQLTCQQLADNLNKGTAYFNAYKEEELQPVIDGCISEYNAELDGIKAYRDQYREIELAGSHLVITISNMLAGLENGQLPKGAFKGPSFTAPIVEAYSKYIDDQLAATLAEINGEKVYAENAFAQLAAAAKSVLANTDIDSEGVVNSTAAEEDIQQAKDWVSEAKNQVTVINDNYLALNTFITQHETSAPSVTTWSYEDSDEINVVCPGKDTLKTEWDELKGNLPGAPDVDGEFKQSDYSQNIEASTENGDACWNAGVESMAWILCPTLNNTATTVSAIDTMTASWLEVDSDYYNNTSAAQAVWEVMRNIANVIMVIFLLIIILSQLTGYGIDNYGIKKMLPKLIMMAILLNLSFVICQLAVDASNILGHGLNTMFRNIAVGLFGEHDVSNIIGWAGAGIFATLGVAGTFAGTAITIATAAMSGGGVMAVIVIVLAVLTALLAILLFFVMLGARMIIVILCISIAPVAFVCYVFPNTQTYFKKWWDLFKAALIIYPICGALGGISYLIKLMVFDMQSSGADVGFFMYLMAMLTPFLPFFVLPSLLKSSIAALGKIGGALTSMGNFVRNGVHGTSDAVRNTDSAKSLMQEGRMNILRRRVGMGENNQLTERGQRRLRRAQERGGARLKMYNAQLASVEKDTDIKKDANAKLYEVAARTAISDVDDQTMAIGADAYNDTKTFAAKTKEAYYAQQFLAAAQSGEHGDINGMSAAIEAALSSGVKTKDVAKMLRYAENSGALNKLDVNTRRAWLQSLATKHGNGFLAKDFELKHWAMRGGVDSSGNALSLGGYGQYGSGNGNFTITDIEKNDLVTLSSDGIAALAAAGKISQGLAQQVLSENPNMTEDKKVMFGAIASGVARVNTGNVAKFKRDAEALVQNHAATAGSTMDSSMVNEKMVNQWLAPPQQRVFITQNDASGYYEQTMPVRVTLEDGGSTDFDIPRHATPPVQQAPQATPVATPAQQQPTAPQTITRSAIDLRALGDETILDIATNPNAQNNDATRTAAEQEYLRRNPGFNNGQKP